MKRSLPVVGLVSSLAVALVLTSTSGLLALPARAQTTPTMALSVSPQAINWQPMAIKDVSAYMPPPPPAAGSPEGKKEMAELVGWQGRRNKDDLKAIAYWSDVSPPLRWSEEIRAEIITASMVPPRAARALAIEHAAMYDAMLVTWRAKAKYKRALPAQENRALHPLAGDGGIPSYPSEHAAISMAAAVTLASLFPDHAKQLLEKARLVGETRIAAGACHRSDVEAGFKIGEQVANEIIAERVHDGAEVKPPELVKHPNKWWVPAPMEPGAGKWRTWLMKNGQQFRMYNNIPDDIKDPRRAAQYQAVVDVHKHLTTHQIERAIYWNFDVPSLLWDDIARRSSQVRRAARRPDAMGIIWSDIARGQAKTQAMDVPHAARMLGVLHMALADAFIGVWDSKFTNLNRRPFMVAPADQPLSTVVPTPPHASWPGGHATASMTAAVILSQYFPKQTKYFDAQAHEAAMSRLWGGIHYPMDNQDGLKLGVRIGKYDLQQAIAHGWTSP